MYVSTCFCVHMFKYIHKYMSVCLCMCLFKGKRNYYINFEIMENKQEKMSLKLLRELIFNICVFCRPINLQYSN